MENILDDQIFSKQLLELSTLKQAHLSKPEYSSHIVLAHGPLVKDQNENILFDLRTYNFKFPFGHGHPLCIRNRPNLKKYLEPFKVNSAKSTSYFECNNLIKNLTASSILTFNIFDELYQLNYEELCHGPLNIFINYFEAVFIKGTRLESIQNCLKSNLDSSVQVHGNTVCLHNNNYSKESLYLLGLYTNDENFINQNLLLYVPITIKDDQLKDLIERINSLIKEA
jgi:hypothetical protein